MISNSSSAHTLCILVTDYGWKMGDLGRIGSPQLHVALSMSNNRTYSLHSSKQSPKCFMQPN